MSTDRLAGVWESLLNAFLGRRAAKTIDACALYWGVVVKASGSTVDVQLDSKEIASPSGVPLYLGFPGSTVTLAGGERVLVGFRNGDPSQPYAVAFEQSSPFSQIQIGTSSPQPAARKGDAVNLGDCHVIVGAGAVTAVFINGVALPVGADPGTANRGTIAAGSAHVKIGG